MLILEYSLTEKEFLDYNYFTGWQSPGAKGYRRSYVLNNLIMYGILVVIIFFAVTITQTASMAWVAAGIFSLVLFIALMLRVRVRFDAAARKFLKAPASQSILSPTTLTITETGITYKKSDTEIKYNWAAFVSKAIVNNCYYLYTNSRLGVIIPFRVFTPTEKEAFDKLIAQHFPLEAEFDSIRK